MSQQFARLSNYEPCRPREIRALRIERLQRPRWTTGVQMVRLLMRFVQQRACAQDTSFRQYRTTQDHATSANEAVIANMDRVAILATGRNIDSMGEELRSVTRNGGERTDMYGIGAIDEMGLGDSAVVAEIERWITISSMGEMPNLGARISGDPVATTNCRGLPHVQPLQVDHHVERRDPGVRTHVERVRENPAQRGDAAPRCKSIT